MFNAINGVPGSAADQCRAAEGHRASFKRFKWLIKTAWKGEIAKLVHVTLTDPERI